MAPCDREQLPSVRLSGTNETSAVSLNFKHQTNKSDKEVRGFHLLDQIISESDYFMDLLRSVMPRIEPIVTAH